jgi:outer membrane protein assembly factor BamA
MVLRRFILASLLAMALLIPAATTDAYEIDTTRIRKPVKPKRTLGQKLLRLPQTVIMLPLHTVEGTVGFVINDIVLTRPVARFSYLFAKVDRVWGFFPVVGYGSNSGFKGGLTFTSKQVFTKGERLKIKATYSTHDYQRYTLIYSAPNKFGAFKRPYFAAGYRKRPWESFYGLGNDSRESDEVTFGLEKTYIGMGWHHILRPAIRLDIDGAYHAQNIYDGEDPNFVGNLDAIAQNLTLSTDDLAAARLVSVGASLSHDWRDNEGQPSRGGYEEIGVIFNQGVGRSSDLGYLVTRLNLRHYLNIFKKRILALRMLVESIDPMGNSPDVPFYLRRYLGGEDDLRGYRRRRFVDNDLALISVEYRYPVWLPLDAFLFLDEARVFESITKDFELANWRYSAGAGLRVWNDEGLMLSTQVAFSDEGMRFYLQVSEKL